MLALALIPAALAALAAVLYLRGWRVPRVGRPPPVAIWIAVVGLLALIEAWLPWRGVRLLLAAAVGLLVALGVLGHVLFADCPECDAGAATRDRS